MFICPSRPVLIEQRPGWGGGRRNASSVELDPLSHEEADQLIGFLLAIDDLPTSTREQIVDKADGNPFFLEEIVQQLMDRGFIENVDGRWRATTDIDDFDIPDTVQAALAARIDLLEPAEKRVLQRAAVVGRIFWPGPVGRLLESDDDLLGILDRLEERDLVRSRLGSSMAGEPEFIFKHVLTREVAYDTLPRRERGDAHATVADWIERTSGDRHGEVGDLLVYHYTEALRTALEDRALDPEQTDRLRRKSFESSLLATQAARFRHARQRSLRLAEQVVGLAEGDEELAIAQEERGRVAVYVYHGDLAWRSFKEAADIYYRQDEPNRKKIAEMCAEAVQTPTRWPGSMKGSVDDDLVEHYIQRGLDHLEEGQDSEERVLLLAARCLHLAAFGSNRLMRPEDEEPARQAGLEAAETARRMGSVALESLALDAFSGIESQLGLFGAHHEVSSRRLHLIEDMEDINEIGDVHAMAAWGMVAVGEYQDAIELARAGVEMTIDEASGFSLNILSQMSVAQFFLGDWKNLWAYTAPTARNILGDDSDDPPYFTTHIWASDAVTKAITGHPDAPRAAELLWKLESNAPGTRGVGVWASWLRSVQGEDPEEQLDTVLFASEIPVNRYLADIAAADIMFQFRSLSRAKEFVSESRAYASRAGMKAIPVHLDRLEATMALENGDLDLAREYADRAAQGFVILDSRWDLARTRVLEAEIRLGQNDVDEARDKTVDALQVFEDLGALRQISAANEMLRSLDA